MSEFSRRDFLKLGGVTFAVGMLGRYAPRVLAAGGEDVEFQVFKHGRRDQAQIALSYDDCQLVKKMQSLETMLRENPEVKVTFFPTGEALLRTNDKDAGIWQRLLEMGHEIGSHTFNHVNPGIRSTQNLLEDYAKWLAALYQVTESRPAVRFARPPYGNLSPSYQKMCVERGLVAAMWSASWGGELALTKKNIAKAENGDVVLLHISSQDVNTNTPYIFSFLKAHGLRSVTMSRLYFASVEEKLDAGSCDFPAYGGQVCPE